ncbi:response regulator transcription factor [Desulfuribacillus alkaliarsenatis]|uniref:DNA-binding response regulator n=1 Tax=Desulfuribacillus alkaliarsenatis TaxID=766136 RepID=A0A1E5G4P4_9FIRM|nr:response regulator transcription factor [Desulfuribacillus alkaliarsenatis]OEF98004.1 DNA-binding response regulator [Desulfuribacillus alkaliarsenatis]
MHQKILVVEDEHKIQRFIRANLVASKYNVITASDGQEAIDMFEQNLPDLILLDIMLPKLNGFQVLEKIREFSSVPIVVITAKGNLADVLKGLELGADDYIVKPFDIQELLARIKTVLRRTQSEIRADSETLLELGDIKINFMSMSVHVKDREITFTPTEFKLLAELAKNVGCVLTHEELLGKIWGAEYRNETQYLRVCVARIRRKLDILKGDVGFIKTVPTVGYMMIGHDLEGDYE